jgi:hypothetical protein
MTLRTRIIHHLQRPALSKLGCLTSTPPAGHLHLHMTQRRHMPRRRRITPRLRRTPLTLLSIQRVHLTPVPTITATLRRQP